MGNCQAAESATVVIQHPAAAAGGTAKVEMLYWSVRAEEVMRRNPGHYVALIVVVSPAVRTHGGASVKQLKLLRPNDTLLLGHVYRLISFEDVLKEFAAKKCMKPGKLLKERGGLGAPEPIQKKSDRLMRIEGLKSDPNHRDFSNNSVKKENENRLNPRRHYGTTSTTFGQWKPALQSISEVETTSSS